MMEVWLYVPHGWIQAWNPIVRVRAWQVTLATGYILLLTQNLRMGTSDSDLILDMNFGRFSSQPTEQ